MRIAVVSALAAVLAGCATGPELTMEQRGARASNVEVCEAVFYMAPHIAQHAQAEASRRGIDCREYMQAATELQQRRTAAATSRAATPQPLIPPMTWQPTYQPLPQTRHCTSTRIGNQVHTTCY